MNRRGRSWRWGALPAIAALTGVAVGYLIKIVSDGNRSVATVAACVFAGVAFFVLTWWDSVRQADRKADTTAGPSVLLKQHIGIARDSAVTAVEDHREISGDYDLQQRVDLSERSAVIGVRHVPPDSSQGRT